MDIEHLLMEFVPHIAGIIESIGIAIILFATIQTVWMLIKGGMNFSDTRPGLKLSQALALALQYIMAGEILKTIIIQSRDDIFLLAGVVVLRVALAFVVHWEIKAASEEVNLTESLESEKKEP